MAGKKASLMVLLSQIYIHSLSALHTQTIYREHEHNAMNFHIYSILIAYFSYEKKSTPLSSPVFPMLI